MLAAETHVENWLAALAALASIVLLISLPIAFYTKKSMWWRIVVISVCVAAGAAAPLVVFDMFLR